MPTSTIDSSDLYSNAEMLVADSPPRIGRGSMSAQLLPRATPWTTGTSTAGPDQLDIDRNGIPCETVYPGSDVDNYWY
jgi:hypothetical protein